MKELSNQFGSTGTNFIEMGIEEFSFVPLNGIVMSVNMPLEDAMKYISSNSNVSQSISQTFTYGHYKEPNHEWELVGYEKYFPVDPCNGSLVILYYRPVNEEFIRNFFSIGKEEVDAYDLVYNQSEDY